MKQKKLTLHITISQDAYRHLGELAPTHKQSEVIRLIIEAVQYFKGNLYDLLGTISDPNRRK